MTFKTTPFKHQLDAFELSRDREVFAYLMEQGTGKTKLTIDVAAYAYGQGRINALLIVAPNGVHVNWVVNEIPKHLHDSIPRRMAVWAAGMTKKRAAVIEDLYAPGDDLRVFAVNVEAFTTEKGIAAVRRFLETFSVLWALDESSRIKNPKAVRTKHIINLGAHAKMRRILTGTPVTQAPFDLFSQFMFLDPWILRTQSFFAFKAQYAEMVHEEHGLMRHIKQRMKQKGGRQFTPQLVARDRDGRPRYKNLDKLAALIMPHSFRVRKLDCLDLPDKLYQRAYCELAAHQRAVYETARKKLRLQLQDGNITTFTKLTLVTRLQQIVGGFGPNADGTKFDVPLFLDPIENPRVRALLDVLEESEGGVIIWARFKAELLALHHVISNAFPDDQAAVYHGGVNMTNRQAIVDGFQRGDIRFFLGQQSTAGLGLTLTAARTVIYYSNEFSLETRLQSEDRAHRIGQHNPVLYVDLEAQDTYDAKVIDVLRGKKDVADLITGDPHLSWI